ncbi:MAG: pentapeptide repeat-containing protein [Bacteroidales bacterium]|nr:pentapeptide repeat-containing protein [Bacteroidales bacterium]
MLGDSFRNLSIRSSFFDALSVFSSSVLFLYLLRRIFSFSAAVIGLSVSAAFSTGTVVLVTVVVTVVSTFSIVVSTFGVAFAAAFSAAAFSAAAFSAAAFSAAAFSAAAFSAAAFSAAAFSAAAFSAAAFSAAAFSAAAFSAAAFSSETAVAARFFVASSLSFFNWAILVRMSTLPEGFFSSADA